MDFFDFPFIQRALAASAFLALGCGPLGVLLVLMRMSLVADSLSHAILPGVAIAVLIGGTSLLALSVGGLAAALVVMLLGGFIARLVEHKEDSTLAVLFAASLSLGALLLQRYPHRLSDVLFGQVFALNWQEIALLALLGLSVAGFMWRWGRPLAYASFDDHFMRRQGPLAARLYYAYLTLLALYLTTSFSAFGTLLSVGFLVIPAVSSQFWSRRLFQRMAIASAIAWACSWLGLWLSYHYTLAAAPTMVMLNTVVYVVSLLFGPCGSHWQRRRTHHHALTTE